MIEICNGVFIRDDELVFRSSRSSGPGGQNVNKVNTRMTVLLDVANSESFTAQQKRRILSELRTRANKDGVVRVASQRYRTQGANREAAIERLVELLRGAIKRRTVRKKTKIPASSKRRRLKDKKRRSVVKQLRGKIEDDI